jgi:acyl-CoA thioester hydrolase
MTETEITARYSETDQMGVIHHGNYLNWFEVGRTACIREFGYTYREVEEKGLMLPVIEANLSYKSPAKYEDVVTILTRVSEYNGIRISFYYEIIRKEDRRSLVGGTTKHCWTNENMKPVSVKKKWPELHEAIENLKKEQSPCDI